MMTPEIENGILAGLGLNRTPGRLLYLREWARFEGTGAAFNPLATTQPGGEAPADPYWNTFGDAGQYHVRNYATVEAGIAATITTLLNGRYNAVINSLAIERCDPAAITEIRTWGTTGFANTLEAGWKPAPWTAWQTAEPATPTPTPPDTAPTDPETIDYVRELAADVANLSALIKELTAIVGAQNVRVSLAFGHLAEGAVLASSAADEGAP